LFDIKNINKLQLMHGFSSSNACDCLSHPNPICA
jgi:hypothetical protein